MKIFEMLKRTAEKYPKIKRDFKRLVKEMNLENLFVNGNSKKESNSDIFQFYF
jgi:hypothetical protein